MLAYTARRLALFVPMVVGIVVVTFVIMQLLPGDTAIILLGEDATPQMLAETRAALGLDKPWYVRLGTYFADLARGDLGRSAFLNESVTTIIAPRLWATLELALVALLISVVLGMTLGIAAALWRGTLIDTFAMLFAQLGVSMPVFWLGILLMLLLAVNLGWLPAIGRGEPLSTAFGMALAGNPGPLLDSLAHLAMPALTLGLNSAAVISRLVRSAMLETLNQDFIRTAHAKGLLVGRVILVHGLRNALLPIISVIGLRFGALLGGAVLTENIFGWPGLGQLAVSAMSQRDIPLIQGVVLCFALLFALVNLLVDLAYTIIDPRVRLD